ncbi:MAG: sugar phosphate isomerase/epimerase family protein [Promethearchaeota archaeon]
MAKFIISCRPASYGKYSKVAFQHWAEIGQKNLELDMPRSEKKARNLLEELNSYNLKALSLSFPIDVDDKRIIKKFQKASKIIRILEPMYIFSSVKVSNESERNKGYPILKTLGDIARELKVFISVETHPVYNTNGDRGKETMENVNHPNVRINYDTANIYYYNKDIDGVEELKKILKWVGSVHIKDCMLNYHEWNFPTIGEGKVNFSEIIKTLDQLDKTIPLTLEIEGVKGENLTLEETKQRIQKSVQYLENLLKK